MFSFQLPVLLMQKQKYRCIILHFPQTDVCHLILPTQSQISMYILSVPTSASILLWERVHVCLLFSVQGGSSWSICSRSSDSSTAYGRALWRMGAVTRQSAYPPTGEASLTTPGGRGENSWTSAHHSFILLPPPCPRRNAAEKLERKDLWPANGDQDASQSELQ